MELRVQAIDGENEMGRTEKIVFCSKEPRSYVITPHRYFGTRGSQIAFPLFLLVACVYFSAAAQTAQSHIKKSCASSTAMVTELYRRLKKRTRESSSMDTAGVLRRRWYSLES
jgi:hypothetical protein